MSGHRERWLDDEAGPLVRPYAITRGRTRARGAPLDLVTILVASGEAVPPRSRLSPEQLRLLWLCQIPHTVADLASRLELPLGVIRVLVDELIEHRLLRVDLPAPTELPDLATLRRIRDQLRTI
ncbi:DUF742 domain-containing protein [Actinomadura barringtoniae]|uniref:DUF742 domain-containing protein n=1 Tax=Actinomadura barringtoniae TaxID=1427535 RepID=A0A939T1U6_9ACTN|nr:DUF742 domain-containing protein [Actinomadura barringtoniae]MBO2448311.1 DUF742 domain-containing protein [Actinomadura barringtoniae]